jgi:hypothetical protein
MTTPGSETSLQPASSPSAPKKPSFISCGILQPMRAESKTSNCRQTKSHKRTFACRSAMPLEIRKQSEFRDSNCPGGPARQNKPQSRWQTTARPFLPVSKKQPANHASCLTLLISAARRSIFQISNIFGWSFLKEGTPHVPTFPSGSAAQVLCDGKIPVIVDDRPGGVRLWVDPVSSQSIAGLPWTRSEPFGAA